MLDLNDGVGFQFVEDEAPAPPRKVTVLPPAVYDVLELSALIHGGIGASCLDETKKKEERVPVCIMGHALWLDGRLHTETAGPVTTAVAKAFGFEPDSFSHVYQINDSPIDEHFDGNVCRSIGDDADGESIVRYRRVSFKKWCKLVGVERGKDRKPKARRVGMSPALAAPYGGNVESFDGFNQGFGHD